MFEFTEVEVPTGSNGAAKHTAHYPLIEKLQESGKAMSVTLPNTTDEDAKAVRTLKAQIQRAGNDLGETIRCRETVGDGSVTLTFWVRPEGKRTRTVKSEG